MNSLLYGHNDTKNIVATESVRGKDNIMQVYYRNSEDNVTSEYIPYTPYTYIAHDDPVIKKFYEDTRYERLLGSNPLNTMVYSDTYSHIKWIEKNSKDYYTPFRQSQWMLQSGETQFKGMDFDDPLRLYFDLEVLTAEGYDFPNSSRPEDKIILIAIWTNRGDELVLALNEDEQTPKMKNVYRCRDEATLIQKFVKCIREINCDILINHNIMGFDFPYLRDRAQLLNVPLQIGRDGSEPYTFNTSIKFAEKSDEYENFSVYGRHVLDTYFFAKRWDQIYRKLDSLSLKSCANFIRDQKLEGIEKEIENLLEEENTQKRIELLKKQRDEILKEKENRTYIEGGDIADVWRGTHDKWTRADLIRYAIDDVKEAQILDQEWGRGIFEQTKMMPLPMQDVSRYGTGNKIDLFFDREYYKYRWSIPIADEKRNYGGGYADCFVYGYINEPTVYMDISSLYPTLSELLKIQPPKDELHIFPELTTLLKEFRYKYKYKAKELYAKGEIQKAKMYDAIQNEMKLILNTASYGWLGWQWGKYNYYDGAELITEWGQLVIKKVNEQAQVLGGQPIKTDTDGSLVIVPERFRDIPDGEDKFIKEVEDNVNKWLESEL